MTRKLTALDNYWPSTVQYINPNFERALSFVHSQSYFTLCCCSIEKSQTHVYTPFSHVCEIRQRSIMFNNIGIGIKVLSQHYRHANIFHPKLMETVSVLLIPGIEPGMYILLIDPLDDRRRRRGNESAAGLIQRFDMNGTSLPGFSPPPPVGGANTVRCHWKLTDPTPDIKTHPFIFRSEQLMAEPVRKGRSLRTFSKSFPSTFFYFMMPRPALLEPKSGLGKTLHTTYLCLVRRHAYRGRDRSLTLVGKEYCAQPTLERPGQHLCLHQIFVVIELQPQI